MLQLVGRRLLLLIPTLILVTFGVFMLITLVPGDPATTLAGGENATPEQIEKVRTQLGLDDPLVVQYGRWVSDAVRLDFGESLTSGQDVTSEIQRRLPVTLSIVVGSIVIGLLIGIPLGLLAGARQGGWIDRFLLALTSIGLAIPNFVLAILFINVFAVNLGWVNPIGFDNLVGEDGLQPGAWLKSLALPALALGIGVAARLARQVRTGVVDTMNEPYIRTAWAKGCSPRTVVGKHVFKNAAMPTVTVAGLLIGGLIGGTVIIESIFSANGVGQYLVNGINAGDLPVIQGVVVMFVLAFAIINIAVDIMYGWLNPKVQVS
ncbi:MAG TPA: ABC transporter permease [Acidimicrobiales bacterium]